MSSSHIACLRLCLSGATHGPSCAPLCNLLTSRITGHHEPLSLSLSLSVRMLMCVRRMMGCLPHAVRLRNHQRKRAARKNQERRAESRRVLHKHRPTTLRTATYGDVTRSRTFLSRKDSVPLLQGVGRRRAKAKRGVKRRRRSEGGDVLCHSPQTRLLYVGGDGASQRTRRRQSRPRVPQTMP